VHMFTQFLNRKCMCNGAIFHHIPQTFQRPSLAGIALHTNMLICACMQGKQPMQSEFQEWL